jgi:ketol-acid reductoisomerase
MEPAMKIFTEKDLRENALHGASVAIVGYGNQGHAHALNLRDGGVRILVGARPGGTGWRRAAADGFQPVAASEAVRHADHVAVLLPDEIQAEAFATAIAPYLRPGAAVFFAHGFAVAFGLVKPPPENDVILVAPKAQGHYLRKAFSEGAGVPCLVAVANDRSGRAMERALSYAQLLGCLGSGAMETTFRDEAVTDLFGEQVVLCGGVPALIRAAFDALVERGYPPEVAYIECLHELKIITDLMHEGGISYMRGRISRTAAWGSFLAEGRIVPDGVKTAMRAILDEIESGAFAEGWRKEASSGAVRLFERMRSEKEHPIERAGSAARSLMQLRKEEDP